MMKFSHGERSLPHSISRGAFVAGLSTVPVALALPGVAQSDTIHAGGTFSDTFAEGFYADALHSFKKSGLDVDITQFANGPAQMTAVLGGALDIGLSDTVSLATAISKSAPFVVIAGAGMYRSAAPTTALCVPTNSALKTAKDLQGKTIAILGLHDVTEIGTWSWLERNGVSPDAVKFAEIPLPQVPGALDRGAVDAGILAEPFLSQSVGKTVRVLAYVFDSVAPQFYISAWFTSKAFYAQHQSQIKQFVNVIYQTAAWANTHRPESAVILSQVTKVPLATVQAMTRVTYGTALDPQLIDPVLAALYKYQVISRRLTAAEMSAT